MGKKEKICMVGYKTGISNACVHGHTFSELKECCTRFRIWFFETGNVKVPIFNGSYAPYNDKKNGINLAIRRGELHVELRLSRGKDDCTPKVDRVRFCPFCGIKIAVKETCIVRLTPKNKNIF